MRCAHCLWKYPDTMLSPMFVLGGYTRHICGICALEITNAIHGIKRGNFQGEMAEANRQSALKWRKTHPNDAPQT